MKRQPAWFETAVAELLNDTPIAQVARLCGVRRETISRALRRPGSALAAEVERRRAATAPVQSEGVAEKALARVDEYLDSEDKRTVLDAAKVALTHAARTQAAAPPEAPPEPEITEAQALEELILAMPAVADLARMGKLPADLVEQFRAACRAFLADDLKPRAPLDVEADRVEITPPATEEPAASSPPGRAQVIPLLN